MNAPHRQRERLQNPKEAINRLPNMKGRSGFDILRDYLFTYFNLLNLLLFGLILLTGSYRNGLFMGVVVSNALIGICQEFYLKRKLSQLKTVRQKNYLKLCDEKWVVVLNEEIQLGDILLLKAGEEVPCDMEVLSTDFLEVNEALMTGEADAIEKRTGDTLLSGSFLVSGECLVRVIRVGAETQYAKMLSQAGKYEKQSSRILAGIEKIIKGMSLVILPLGIILFVSSFYREEISWQEAVITTTAGIVGMIPSGLYLITTITAGSAVLKLLHKKAVVNSFSSVECLSRVTALCLDKTGTLTTGEISLYKLISYEDDSVEILKLFSKAFPAKNPTLEGIFKKYGSDTALNFSEAIPFSSERKYARIVSGGVCYQLGAVERLILEQDILQTAEEYIEKGYRVLGLCKDARCMALVILSDVVKESAKEVLDYCRQENIDLKIISGDHPKTVSHIAQQLNFHDWNRYVDLGTQKKTPEHYRELVKQYSIFGRVTPEDKQQLIRAMKENGETVAMVGDGVNDVLALKEADLSIAMAGGDQATKAVSQIVLSESDFAPVPHILREGRRIVNNIERVAGLYLMKTGYSLLLTICFSLLGLSYPFSPIGMTVIGVFTVGLPSFFLAMEPSDRPVSDDFLHTVILKSMPTAVLIALFVTFFGILEKVGFLAGKEAISFYLTAYFCFFQLIRCSLPFSLWKGIVIVLAMVGFFICLCVPNLLVLPPLSLNDFILFGTCLLVGSVLLGRYDSKIEKEAS